MAIPGVVSVARTNLGVAARNKSIVEARVPGSLTDTDIGFYHVDPDYFPTMGMRLLAGRIFSEERGQGLLGAAPVAGTGAAERALNIVRQSTRRREAWLLAAGPGDRQDDRGLHRPAAARLVDADRSASSIIHPAPHGSPGDRTSDLRGRPGSHEHGRSAIQQCGPVAGHGKCYRLVVALCPRKTFQRCLRRGSRGQALSAGPDPRRHLSWL